MILAGKKLNDHPNWDLCSFRGDRDHVLRSGIRTSFREKLERLENAAAVSALFRKPKERVQMSPCEKQPNKPA
jgi:hypothetical protein